VSNTQNIGDQDEAQRHHNELLDELRMHMCIIFARPPGLCPDPVSIPGQPQRSTSKNELGTPMASFEASHTLRI
jgi:hypothetical protein